MKETEKKRTIYIYDCMDCDYEWESTWSDETFCPMCHCGDLAMEEDEEDED